MVVACTFEGGISYRWEFDQPATLAGLPVGYTIVDPVAGPVQASAAVQDGPFAVILDYADNVNGQAPSYIIFPAPTGIDYASGLLPEPGVGPVS